MKLNTDVIFIYRRNLDHLPNTRPVVGKQQNQEANLGLYEFKAHSFNYFQF